VHKARSLAWGTLGLTAILALGACGGQSAGADASPGATDGLAGSGKTITVWGMADDLSDATIAAINAKFTEKTGAEVKVEVQAWDGITTKVTTALSTSTPPDVMDLGNTQIPGYAANGGLLDLTDHKADLEQGQKWLGGLADPATVDGALYGVPSFAGSRAVIYNKTMWAAAGVTQVPTTYEELTAALDAVAAANQAPDFSAFYLPGQYWYAGLPFIWDAGGGIAELKDGKWTATFSSPESQKGISDFKEFQNAYSTKASQTLYIHAPEQNQLFADGKTSAIFYTAASISKIIAANPALTEADLGTFPLPGKSGSAAPVSLGGSDWGIAAKSQNQELALEWVKIAVSPEIQSTYVYGKDGWIPNSEEGIKAAMATDMPELTKGFFQAALNSRSTPAAANWPTIESDNTLQDLFSAVASGSKTTEDAAKAVDAHVASVLNGN
jgi:N,N'-diacetylchitobiose transport system substrate-binding protein